MKRDIEAVITSYNQGTMILEAVRSVCSQTLLPERIIIVDDGSTDKESLAVLGEMKNSPDFLVPVIIQFQENQGVSAARNTGIRSAHSSMVLVLDGDDRIEKEYIEKVYHLLLEHPSMVIASSWMRTFGTLDAIVRPSGGNIVLFYPTIAVRQPISFARKRLNGAEGMMNPCGQDLKTGIFS